MTRFLIEHLPRTAAHYCVVPFSHAQAKVWLADSFSSLVRTTELISATEIGFDVSLHQADELIALRPGDEALLITLSFGVLLAWAQGKIPPLPDDWRCLLITVAQPPTTTSEPVLKATLAEELPVAIPTAALAIGSELVEE